MKFEAYRYSVGKITPIPMREVRQSDFAEQARIKMYFPRKGSRLTPPHRSIDFYWKDYCPIVFRYLMHLRVYFMIIYLLILLIFLFLQIIYFEAGYIV